MLFCVMFRTPNTPKYTCTPCRRPSRGANRCPPTPQLGTVLQPASQVPESRHSGFNGTNENRVVSCFVRLMHRNLHALRAGVRARRLNRRRLASRLGTPYQPAARVPSFHHSGLNGTNDNREYSAHPCASPLRGQRKRCSNLLQANLSMPPSFFRRYQSANPNLHDSLGCPVMCRKRSKSKQKVWPFFSLSGRR
jgi:hypothetical protein